MIDASPNPLPQGEGFISLSFNRREKHDSTDVECSAGSAGFGAKKITDRFISEGIPIKGVIAIGGIAQKSPFIMQMMSDILNMPMGYVRSSTKSHA